MPRDCSTSGRFNTSDAARDLFQGRLPGVDLSREHLWVAYIDERGHCVHVSQHLGGREDIRLPLRCIIRSALEHKCAYLVLAHNHPSGDPRPSDLDKRATRQLAFIAEALDVRLLDHLVFGGSEYSSFRELGLL